jgi:hypothetical protein
LAGLQAISRRAGIRTPGVPTFVISETVLVGFDGPEGVARQLRQLARKLQRDLAAGAVNLADAARASQRYTLAIPDDAKPGLVERMRGVLQSRGLAPALVGVAMLAVVVNLVKLLCTAGLPALYTAVMSQQALPAWAHYGYLGLYILG